MHVYSVTIHMDRKDPKESPVIETSLVLANSFEQATTATENTEFLQSRIVKVELLASDTCTAAPYSLHDRTRAVASGKQSDQGKDRDALVH